MIYCAIIAFFLCFVFIFYISRHSWATEALRQNIPVAVISQAMGHTSEKTTRIYLAQLDQSVLNKANAKITKKAADMFLERA